MQAERSKRRITSLESVRHRTIDTRGRALSLRKQQDPWPPCPKEPPLSATTRGQARLPPPPSLPNPHSKEARRPPALSRALFCWFLPPVFAAGFCRRFSSGKTKTVRSGSNDSAMTGCDKPHALHPSTIFGRPLPARSPISTRENIFAIVALRGSETPPARALSISTRNPPGFASSMRSGVFKTTNPRRPQ